jgi:crotonobetainyl-CoA:carnitine CoA-transferase CaiB-like acyl-CoA transferase
VAGPLDGIRVVDLTINVLGPVATQILGDMGADVIKIETPDGDPMRRLGPARHPDMAAFFLNLNRNKRSVVLDLKQPDGLGALLRLVETADVFVHNMRLPAAERLGIGAAAVMARNPRIVYAAATGFRKDGKWRDRPAYDDVIQGATGIAALNRRASGEARYIPMAFADKFCGYVLASAIGMALFRRERTGRGEEVHVPMFETVLSFNMLEHLWTATFDDGKGTMGYPRMLTQHRRPYPTKDGHVCLLATTDEQWRRLFSVFGTPELAEDERFATLPARTQHIDTLYGLLADLLGRHTTEECRRLLDAADIPNGPMNELDDLLHDPYVCETGFFQTVSHPTEGALLSTTIPVAFAGSPGEIRRLAPRLDEHTAEVLAEIGYNHATR